MGIELKRPGQDLKNSPKKGGENSHNSHIIGHVSTFLGRWIPHCVRLTRLALLARLACLSVQAKRR